MATNNHDYCAPSTQGTSNHGSFAPLVQDPEIIPFTANGAPQIPGANDDNWDKFSLLSLDGGGIRGYWSLLALKKLMDYIAEEETKADGDQEALHSFHPEPYPDNVSQLPPLKREGPRQPVRPEEKLRNLSADQRYLPCHYFDYICGTSTGALIAIMLGRFRMTVADCLYEYECLGRKVFGKPRFFTKLNFAVIPRSKYNARHLQEVCEDITARRSEQVSEEDIHIPTFPSRRGLCKTFVSTLKTNPDRKQEELYLIRSYDYNTRQELDPCQPRLRRPTDRSSPEGEPSSGKAKRLRRTNQGNAQQLQIWQVARAATAAPFYFKPLKIRIRDKSGPFVFEDSGFGHASNPTQEGTYEIEAISGVGSIDIVVSVGTARDESCAKGWWMKPVIKKVVKVGSDPGPVHESVVSRSKKDGFSYHRFNDVDKGLKMELDDWKPRLIPRLTFSLDKSGLDTLEAIRTAFRTWMDDMGRAKEFQSCAAELVRRRRARINNPRMWERYATGAQYRCVGIGCLKDDFFNREDFKAHLVNDHRMKDSDADSAVKDRCDAWRYRGKA